MEMVKIEIDDNNKFQDITLLVDQDKFLEYITELRQIVGLPVSIEEYPIWCKRHEFFALSDEDFNAFSKWFNKVPSSFANQTRPENLLTADELRNKVKVYSKVNALKDGALRLYDTFRKSNNYIPAIEAAIAVNVVSESDYETAFLTLYSPKLKPNDMRYLPSEEQDFFRIPEEPLLVALYFQPNASRSELVAKIDQRHKYIPVIERYQKLYNQKINYQDPISNIRWYREWYWIKKKDKNVSYQQIANMEIEKPKAKRIHGEIYLGRIKQGIKDYKKFLKKAS